MNSDPEQNQSSPQDHGFLTPSYLPASREISRVMTNAPSPDPHRGWFSRGYLPHWDQPGMIQSIGFRLHDALPREVVERWRMQLVLGMPASPSVPPLAEKQNQLAGKAAGAPRIGRPMDWREIELRKRIARYEDEGHGSSSLRDLQVGRMVEEALLRFDGERYRLLAWCVMPNHVHVLVETKPSFPLSELLHSWKSFTAGKANQMLGRKGKFWQREYFDRYIRNAEHFAAAVRYIDGNAARAGLVKYPADWPFTSARFRRAATPASVLVREEKAPNRG